MLDDRYEVRTSANIEAFEFDSIGPKGTIKKVVRYPEINIRNFYNLGFGDKDVQTGFISDLNVTDNNDRRKVLATVAATLYAFTDSHPGLTIIAAGSTEARTRYIEWAYPTTLKRLNRTFLFLDLQITTGSFFAKM